MKKNLLMILPALLAITGGFAQTVTDSILLKREWDGKFGQTGLQLNLNMSFMGNNLKSETIFYVYSLQSSVACWFPGIDEVKKKTK